MLCFLIVFMTRKAIAYRIGVKIKFVAGNGLVASVLRKKTCCQDRG